MVSRLNPCNPDALRLLLSDRLPPVAVGELEDHLQRCPACRRALDDLAGGPSWWGAVRESLSDPEPHPEPVDDALDFLAPSDEPDSLGRVGPYEVKGVLGRGGNGIVLKAFDPGLNRFVAVKVIASVLAGSGAARKRFAREAQAAAAVVHEHVVAVFAVDEAGGLPYLVMEYVPGRSVQARIDAQGPLELKEILRIALQTAAGLAAAHAQGLVHRDIKPANILLENGVERVKITDFGLARAVADATLTQSGVITGTPHYMAPEQARGETIDHRADLFSLGSTIYAMCTGHPPFRAETPLAVLRRVTDEDPRPVREENPDIPEWLDGVIAKLMAKDPADRFQTAGEVTHLLEKCLAHVQSPLTAELPRLPKVKRPAKPKPKPRRTRAVVVLGMVAAWVGLTLTVALAPPDALPVAGLVGNDPPPQKSAELTIKSGTEMSPSNGWGLHRAGAVKLEPETRTFTIPPDPEREAPPRMGVGNTRLPLKYFDAWEPLQRAGRQLFTPGRQPDVIALVVLDTKAQAAQVEREVRDPTPSAQPDPLDAAIDRVAERLRALEHELTPHHRTTR